MRCTAKKTFEAAAQADIALIVQVKSNQPTLHEQIQSISATTAPLRSACSHDKGRNRDERRTVAVLDPADTLADTDWQPHIAAIIRVERRVYTRNTVTGMLRCSTETAFYVSNTPVTATRAAEAIRAHWRIENTSHYSRDITLGEDRSRIRTNPGVASPSTSSKPIRPTPSARIAIAPASQASKNCSECSLLHSVEQPCVWDQQGCHFTASSI